MKASHTIRLAPPMERVTFTVHLLDLPTPRIGKLPLLDGSNPRSNAMRNRETSGDTEARK